MLNKILTCYENYEIIWLLGSRCHDGSNVLHTGLRLGCHNKHHTADNLQQPLVARRSRGDSHRRRKLIRRTGDKGRQSRTETDRGINQAHARPWADPRRRTKFGYACDGLDDYDVSGVITSLCNDRPVYMRGKDKNTGEGHAWVADGYYYISEFHTYYSADDLSVAGNYTKVTYYLHMNWGWDGGEKNKNNGYYLSSVFNPEIFSTDTYEYIEYNYSDDLQMICNIRYAN